MEENWRKYNMIHIISVEKKIAVQWIKTDGKKSNQKGEIRILAWHNLISLSIQHITVIYRNFTRKLNKSIILIKKSL